LHWRHSAAEESRLTENGFVARHISHLWQREADGNQPDEAREANQTEAIVLELARNALSKP
jgi:hypothetical protein